MIGQDVILEVSDFVALLNQTFEFAYPNVVIKGELANFRVSKNRWVYFDLKDESSSVKFFGTVYQLPGPLENGMMLQVRGTPRLHNLYGFSVNIQSIQPVGEGSIKKAQALLEAKLVAEGLFDTERKRMLQYPPKRIGLIASGESAAYKDFIKILNARWTGVEVIHADVQVQGEAAPGQIITALEHLNLSEDLDVIVLTRGGGSPEDLAAFSTEQVTRAVAASRTPTLVAIGHEIDVSLAELAADQRASTPSNAAELLVPDKRDVLANIAADKLQLGQALERLVLRQQENVHQSQSELNEAIQRILQRKQELAQSKKAILKAYDPLLALKRGYAIARLSNGVIKSVKEVQEGDNLNITVSDGNIKTVVAGINRQSEI